MSPQAFDITVGSVSSSEFQIDRRLKIYKPLSERLEFRLTWFADRDLEEDANGQILELVYWSKKGFGFSVYGDLSLYKAENDVGLALLKKLADGESRLYVTLPDFQRNKRTLDSDRWQREPHVFGFISRRQPGADRYTEISYRYETSSRWELPAEQRTYDFQRDSWQILSIRKQWSLRLFGERKHEVQAPLNASPVSEEVWDRKRYFAFFERRMEAGGRVLRAGLHWFYRDYEHAGRQAVIRELLPVLWYEVSPRWHLGYDHALHWVDDFEQLLGEPRKSFAANHRLNVEFNHAFSDVGQVKLLFTFDVDRFGSGETWEGGAGMLQLNF